jgi:VWFA-related protein
MVEPRRQLKALIGLGLLAACVDLLAGSSLGQQPSFRASTLVIPVDVRVVDKDGRPVTDLKQSDFRITENKVSQSITQFWSGGVGSESGSPPDNALLPRRGALTATPQPPSHRVFLIVLGHGNLTGPSKGLDGLMHLVRDRLLPPDRVAIMAWNRATPFTTDHDAIVRVVERLQKEQLGINLRLARVQDSMSWLYGDREIPHDLQREIDAIFQVSGTRVRSVLPSVTAETAELDRKALQQVQIANGKQVLGDVAWDDSGRGFDDFLAEHARSINDLSGLLFAIDYLRQFDGEKHVVWLSEYGLPVRDTRVTHAAADARIVLNVIRAGGVETPYAARQGIMEAGSLTASQAIRWSGIMYKSTLTRELVEATGGRYDANKFPNSSIAADYIEQASRFDYLLGYTPSNTQFDGKYRDIRVEVRRPGVTVLYRHGYFASVDEPRFDRREELSFARIAAAAQYPGAIPDVGLTATVSQAPRSGGPSEVRLEVRVDPKTLEFHPVDGRETATVSFGVFCLDKDQKPVGEFWSRIDVAMPAARRAEVSQAGGAPITLVVPVKAQATSVKVVAYDYYSDLVGTRNRDLSKPTKKLATLEATN